MDNMEGRLKKSLNIPKGYSEPVNQRTDSTMAKKKSLKEYSIQNIAKIINTYHSCFGIIEMRYTSLKLSISCHL